MEQIGAVLTGLFLIGAAITGTRQMAGSKFNLRQTFTDLAVTCILLIVGFFLAKLFFGG